MEGAECTPITSAETSLVSDPINDAISLYQPELHWDDEGLGNVTLTPDIFNDGIVPTNTFQFEHEFPQDLNRVHRLDHVLPFSSTMRQKDLETQPQTTNIDEPPLSPPITEMQPKEPALLRRESRKQTKGSFGWLKGKFKK